MTIKATCWLFLFIGVYGIFRAIASAWRWVAGEGR
jgi:hypothetical protein